MCRIKSKTVQLCWLMRRSAGFYRNCAVAAGAAAAAAAAAAGIEKTEERENTWLPVASMYTNARQKPPLKRVVRVLHSLYRCFNEIVSD